MNVNCVLPKNLNYKAHKSCKNVQFKKFIKNQQKFTGSLECIESQGRYISGRKENPQIKFKFNSLKEASEYFTQKYGVEADFNNLMQAQTVKSVIDEYIKLPGINDEKFLYGIKIKSTANPNPNMPNIKAAINTNMAYQYSLNEDEVEIYKKYCAEGREDEFKEKFIYTANNIKPTNISILFSDKITDSKELRKEIIKAIGKIVCLKHSPREFIACNNAKLNKEELEIARKAGFGELETISEFKTEYIVKRFSGEIFDRDVVDLYKKFDGPNIFRDWDEIKPIFSSLDDVSLYFLKEYGIDASFDDVEQAGAFKNVLDKFIALPIINNKRFLEGLKIGTTNSMTSAWDVNEKTNADTAAAWHRIKDEIILDEMIIRLNSNTNFKWDSSSIEKSRDAYFSQNAIAHEIGHVLHAMNSPKSYLFKNSDTPDDQECQIMKKVSKYATKNRNEFAAEYIANRLLGKTYDREVIELYKKIGAPDLFEEF